MPSTRSPAETYESFMVPTLFAPWAERLLRLAGPRPGERTLDLACGTGIVARRLASSFQRGERVIGLDLNPDMLAVARERAARDGLAIEFHEGRAEALPFPPNSFELVLCQQALQFFADRQAALSEVHRVLVEGGRLALSAWRGLDHHPFYRTLHDVIGRRIGRSSLDQIFALGSADELRRLLTGAGFREVAIESVELTARFPDPEAFLAGEIDVDTASIPSMQQLDLRERQEIVAAIRGEMEAPLRRVTERDQVVIPFHAQLALAVRRSEESS